MYNLLRFLAVGLAGALLSFAAFAGDMPHQENVRIHNPKADIDLAATLILPPGKGPFPAVLMISDFGRQVRAGFGNFPEELAEHGIAVLIYDKRGAGQSGGNYASADIPEFRADAAVAADYLRERPDVFLNHTGVLGTGEGALIASQLAAKNPAISFCVLIGFPATAYTNMFEEEMLKKGDAKNRAQHLSETDVARGRVMLKGILDAEIHSRTREEENKAIRAVFDRVVAAHDMTPDVEEKMLAGWSQRIIPYPVSMAPEVSLHQLKLPVLVVYGGRDKMSPPEENLPRIQYALENLLLKTFRVLPGDNHILQRAKTGGMAEWSQLGKPYNDRTAVSRIAEWISQAVK